MKPLTGIKWLRRQTYFWFEDDSEAAPIRGWIKGTETRSWQVDLRADIAAIYIEAYYDRKKDAIAAIPQLLRALPDEWQAAIGRLP